MRARADPASDLRCCQQRVLAVDRHPNARLVVARCAKRHAVLAAAVADTVYPQGEEEGLACAIAGSQRCDRSIQLR